MSCIHTNNAFGSPIQLQINKIQPKLKAASIWSKFKFYPLWLIILCTLSTVSIHIKADDSSLYLSAIEPQAYMVSDYTETYIPSPLQQKQELFNRQTEIDISHYVNPLLNDYLFNGPLLHLSSATSFLFSEVIPTDIEQGSDWKITFEGLEIGGAQQQHPLTTSIMFNEEISYANRLVQQSYQYLGWGTKLGKRIVLSHNLTTLVHFGAFNWEHVSTPLNSVDTGQQGGISPYGGIELNYQVESNSTVQLKWAHFELNETQLEQFGVYFSHRF